MPQGTIEFVAAEYDADAVIELFRSYSNPCTVVNVQAHVTSRHSDYESSQLADEVCEKTGWNRLRDHNTDDDGASMLMVTVDASDSTIESLRYLVGE